MKKYLFALLALLCASFTMSAQNTASGCYRGLADAGYTIGIGDYDMGRFEINTSHGYQINPFIYLGAGLGLHFMPEYETPDMDIALDCRESKVDIPVFANAKINMSKGKYVPFVDGKIGTYVTNNGGLYMNISAGLRIATNERQAVNISVGYTREDLEFESFDSFFGTSSMKYYTSSRKLTTEGIAIKIGYEF